MRHDKAEHADLGWLCGREGSPRPPAAGEEDWVEDADRPDIDEGLYIGDDVRTRRVPPPPVDDHHARDFAGYDRDRTDRADFNPERFGGSGEPRYQDRDAAGRFIGDDDGVSGFER